MVTVSSKHIFLITLLTLILIIMFTPVVSGKELKRELVRTYNETLECGHSRFAVFFVNKTAYKLLNNEFCIVKVTYTYNVTYTEVVHNKTVIKHKLVNETKYEIKIISKKLVKTKMPRSAEEIFEEIKRITLTLFELFQIKLTYVLIGVSASCTSLAVSYYVAKRKKEMEIEAGFR